MHYIHDALQYYGMLWYNRGVSRVVTNSSPPLPLRLLAHIPLPHPALLDILDIKQPTPIART
jgi:hypothetical protein